MGGIGVVVIFQFHNGTIKTTSKKFDVYCEEQFQFHNGTIKTRHRSGDARWTRISIP